MEIVRILFIIRIINVELQISINTEVNILLMRI